VATRARPEPGRHALIARVHDRVVERNALEARRPPAGGAAVALGLLSESLVRLSFAALAALLPRSYGALVHGTYPPVGHARGRSNVARALQPKSQLNASQRASESCPALEVCRGGQ
jgi:hypothetical protein